jgi:heme-degrading monooxygenase HmoA
MTVVSVLMLPVREGAGEELVRTFARLEIFEHSRQSGGFLSGRLHRPLGHDDSFLVLAEWESAEAYQGWLANPSRAELAERLAPLLSDEVAAGDLFEDTEEAR